MNEQELYRQKRQAQLDEWKADLAKFKAKASGVSADAQLQWNRQIGVLEGRIEEGVARLAELTDAGEGAWESIRDGVEASWDTLKSAFSDAAAKLRE